MRAYREILSLPGALRFCAAGLLARAGGAMMGIGTVLMVSALYGSYTMAGALSATNGLAWAIGTAWLSGMVDRHGQRRVMYPAAIVSALALSALVVQSVLHMPIWTLFIPAALSGLAGGSPGALVRARWNHVTHNSEQLHTAFSLESALDEFTFMIGPVVATALSTGVHPAAALAVPVVLGLVGAQLFYSQRETEPPLTPRVISDGKKVRNRIILAFSGVAPIIATNVLIGCAFGSIDVSVVAAASSWGVRSESGLALAAFSLASGLAGLAYGARHWSSPLVRRFGIGVLAMSVATWSLLLTHHIVFLALAGMLFGLTVAPTLINANTLIEQLVPRGRLTEGLAWMGTGLGIGTSIGSSAAGRVIDVAGAHAGFWCVVVFAGVAMLISVVSLPTIQRSVSTAAEAAPTVAEAS